MPVINLKIDTRYVRSSGTLLFDYRIEQDNLQLMSLRMMIDNFPVEVYGGQLQSVMFSYPKMNQPPIIWSCNEDDIQRKSDATKKNLYEADNEASDNTGDDTASDIDINSAAVSDLSMEIYRIPKSCSDDDKFAAEESNNRNPVYVSSSDEEASAFQAQLEDLLNQWQEATKPKVA